jgi:putative restriction endonuclease
MIAAEPLPRNYYPFEGMARGHQAGFRIRVLMAYGYRCALTGLPLPDLLEAAHIVPDARDGEASVRNGIAMSRLHHAAYERNLLGIDPDGKIHLSRMVREARDGPLLDHGLLYLDGRTLSPPVFAGHQPSRDFLAVRYNEFCDAAR